MNNMSWSVMRFLENCIHLQEFFKNIIKKQNFTIYQFLGEINILLIWRSVLHIQNVTAFNQTADYLGRFNRLL